MADIQRKCGANRTAVLLFAEITSLINLVGILVWQHPQRAYFWTHWRQQKKKKKKTARITVHELQAALSCLLVYSSPLSGSEFLQAGWNSNRREAGLCVTSRPLSQHSAKVMSSTSKIQIHPRVPRGRGGAVITANDSPVTIMCLQEITFMFMSALVLHDKLLIRYLLNVLYGLHRQKHKLRDAYFMICWTLFLTSFTCITIS